MDKRVKIVDSNGLNGLSIDEYLKNTYGEKKLEQSKRDSSPTVLDVVGYTLDKQGLETVEGKYYEVDEIVGLAQVDLNDEGE